MSSATLNVRLKSAYKTEAEWALATDVPLVGEILYTSGGAHHGWYKIGDGTHTWSNLNYAFTIPTVPTTVSSFTNDAGYLTLATLPKYDGTVE